jgi:hypothetical protein
LNYRSIFPISGKPTNSQLFLPAVRKLTTNWGVNVILSNILTKRINIAAFLIQFILTFANLTLPAQQPRQLAAASRFNRSWFSFSAGQIEARLSVSQELVFCSRRLITAS